ncbi:MAG: hypothetical protein ACLQLC_02170 [Candidatus Sulfotelmatobacter sp.]
MEHEPFFSSALDFRNPWFLKPWRPKFHSPETMINLPGGSGASLKTSRDFGKFRSLRRIANYGYRWGLADRGTRAAPEGSKSALPRWFALCTEFGHFEPLQLFAFQLLGSVDREKFHVGFPELSETLFSSVEPL